MSMRIPVWLVAALMAGTAQAAPFAFGGGGLGRTDCLAVFFGEPNFPPTQPRHVRCADGEACDADGVVNGVCQIPLAACLNSSFDPSRCTESGVGSVAVGHALDNGDPRFDPEFQAFQTRIDAVGLPSATPDVCSLPTNFRVSVYGPFVGNSCSRGTKKLELQTRSVPVLGRVVQDNDAIRLQCDPSPTLGCDPLVLYTSTFDRIQTQIFDQSCALSGCHDSQSQMSGLLLEAGASLGNLIDVTPQTAAAAAAGWKRVLPGNRDASLLYHKIRGSLPDASYGERMPRDKRRLNPSLILVIDRWIQAGAPATGWVPDTF